MIKESKNSFNKKIDDREKVNEIKKCCKCHKALLFKSYEGKCPYCGAKLEG